jgi:hypothetical protein
MNEIEGDEKMEQASNDFHFEDDGVGGDDWFACIYLTLVYDVRFGYGLKKLKLYMVVWV